jgi:hypothetical protein
MKKRTMWLVFCAALLTCVTVALAQDAKPAEHSTPTQALDRYVSNVEHEFVPAAEAMPEGRYSFAPSNGEFKGVRTFGEQVMHVATTNYILGAAILGEKPPIEPGKQENGPDSIKTKAEIVKYLNGSFAYLHKALASINKTNMMEPIKSPFGNGNTTRFAVALIAAGHPWDHYGQMVEYLRMNGIIPPASRR